MSNEKYLEVKLENRMLDNGFKAIKPEDIIYLEHWFDTSYDHSSENMGHFITLIYNKGGEVVAEWFNPDDWKPIGNLIKEGKDTFVKTKKHLWGIHSFFNKNALKDLRIEKGRLVYKDKYIFNPETFEAFGGKTLWLPDSFDSKNFESYTPDHAKDPLKD